MDRSRFHSNSVVIETMLIDSELPSTKVEYQYSFILTFSNIAGTKTIWKNPNTSQILLYEGYMK